MIEFCAETYGWTPRQATEGIPWASVVEMLEARAERLRREQPDEPQPLTQGENLLKPVGENAWGIGVT